MWFKNLLIYRLPAPWAMTSEQLEEMLATQAFAPGSSIEMQTQGWAPPRDNGGLVHAVGGHLLINLRTEKKLLPASVINQVAKAKATEIEEQQGFKPGRKQMKDIKENVTDALIAQGAGFPYDANVIDSGVEIYSAIIIATPRPKVAQIMTRAFKAAERAATKETICTT